MRTAPACPYCDSDHVTPQGRVVVVPGEVRAAYRCRMCGRDFGLTVRAVDRGGPPDPRPLAESLTRRLTDALPRLAEGRAVPDWQAWREDLQQLSALSAPRTYLVHARAIHLAKGDAAELLTIVQVVLAKLKQDYP